jgi:uncharacterized membrane protein YhaH (DUF805 family)
MDIAKLLFSFEGRMGRHDFWIGWLILFAAGFVLSFLPLLNIPIFFILIYPKVCIYTKRLHDMGLSGWLQLIPWALWIATIVIGFVTFGAALISALMAGNNDSAALAGILTSAGVFLIVSFLATVISLGFWLWVGCTPGQRGGSRYGDDLYGELSEEVF